MSKLIVKMEMPKRCGVCKCRRVEFDLDRVAVFCAIKDNKYVEDPYSRPPWCPIVGVLPDEHGDLIDRDALKKRCWHDDGFDLWVSHTEIDQQPTVVAAERKDNGTTAD